MNSQTIYLKHLVYKRMSAYPRVPKNKCWRMVSQGFSTSSSIFLSLHYSTRYGLEFELDLDLLGRSYMLGLVVIAVVLLYFPIHGYLLKVFHVISSSALLYVVAFYSRYTKDCRGLSPLKNLPFHDPQAMAVPW